MQATRTGSRAVAALTALVLGVLAPAAARAQAATTTERLGGIALDTFDPAPIGDSFFGVPGAATPGHGSFRFGALFDYSSHPLTLGPDQALVGHQGFLHVGASLALWNRLLVSASMPFALIQNGDDPVVSGVRLESPRDAELGDLRLGARIRLYGGYFDPFQVAVGSYLYLPTAGSNSFAGEGAVRGHPHLSLGGRVPGSVGFVWSAMGGVMVRASDNPNLLTFGAGAGLTFADELLQIGPELLGAQQIGAGDPLEGPTITVQASSRTNLELLGGAKLRILDGLTLGAAAGPGLSEAIGTPKYRVLALLAWAPPPPPEAKPDTDGDGFLDEVDACPNEKGLDDEDATKRGCPKPDRDHDGVADRIDACPDEKGRANADATRNGCPADYDRDGIADDKDACPNQKGVASAEAARNGCPGDVDGDLDGIADSKDACPKQKGVASEDPSKNGCPIEHAGSGPATASDGDGDGIADAKDACPTEAGKPNKDPARNGCPDKATAKGALDLPRIAFDFGKAGIGPEQEAVLGEVATGLKARTDVAKVEIQGHANDVGDAAYNQTLSAARANAVKSWLVAHGIAPGRLVVKGYGSSRPLTSGGDDASRRQNRRVELAVAE